jgi:hypothetical protein
VLCQPATLSQLLSVALTMMAGNVVLGEKVVDMLTEKQGSLSTFL